MNLFKSLSSAIRKLSILILIISLISFFLFLYYFRYVPSNRDRLQRQGFLILKQQEAGFKQSSMDLANYFLSQKLYLADSATVISKQELVSFYSPVRFSRKIDTLKSGNLHLDDNDTLILRADYDYTQGRINYNIPGQKYKVTYSLSFDQVYRNILDNGRKDFFESYFVLDLWKETEDRSAKEIPAKGSKKAQELTLPGDADSKSEAKDQRERAHVVYHSASLSITDQLPLDSVSNLLTNVEFPKILNLEIGNRPFKAFLHPFQFREANKNKNTLILVGLMPDNEYNDRLQNIPFSTVSIIIILFFLVLISMPYLKVFFISPEEKFGIGDIVSLSITMIVGSAFLLIILQHSLMRVGSGKRTEEEIRTLSAQVQRQFKTEIHQCCQTLNTWDRLLNMRLNNTPSFPREEDSIPINVKSRNKIINLSVPGSLKSYSNYTLVQWANDSGNQVYKVTMDEKLPVLSPVKQRQYFKDISENRLFNYHIKGLQTDSFAFQPTYSMSSGLFEANISKHTSSPEPRTIMIALSAQLYSVINTIFPAGYGFYIIDPNGVIQFQSEGQVTLKENFLEWINEKQNLAFLLKSRQNRYITEQIINNKSYSAFIQPLDNLPYSLIVYHCNDENTASILHVSSFTVFFTLIYFPVIFLLCFVAWKNTSFFSILYQPVFQYKWLKPGKDKTNFFSASIIFLLIYTGLTSWFLIDNSHQSTVWFVGYFFPISALWTLYLLFRLFYLSKLPRAGIGERIIRSAGSLILTYNIVPILTLGGLTIIFWRIQFDHEARMAMLSFTFMSLSLIPIMTLLMPYLFHTVKASWQPEFILIKHPLNLYAIFWMMTIIAICFVPIHCFFEYAQEREINSVIRGRQLMQAQATEGRLTNSKWFEKFSVKMRLTESEKNHVLYSLGIYHADPKDELSIGDSAKVDTNSPVDQSPEPYDIILQDVSWNYHSLDKFRTIESHSGDDKWTWNVNPEDNQRKAVLKYKISPEIRNSSKLTQAKGMILTSNIPSFWAFYGFSNMNGAELVILASLILLCIFFMILRNITYRIFFLGFKSDVKKNGRHSLLIEKWMNKDYFFNKSIRDAFEHCNPRPQNEELEIENIWRSEFICRRNEEDSIRRLEDRILGNQLRFEKLYDCLWKECSDKEKYFLYNICKDGFTNYKNSTLIHRMLDKGFLIMSENSGLNVMSISFRNYVLDKTDSEETDKLTEKFHKQGSWSNIRTPVLIAITAFGTFLFITQEDLIQRIAALVPTVSAIFGLGAMVLGSKSSSRSPK